MVEVDDPSSHVGVELDRGVVHTLVIIKIHMLHARKKVIFHPF